MRRDPEARARGVQSVKVSMRILKAVAAAGGPAALSEIAADVAMAPAKVHRYLASLIEAGMIVQRKSGAYDLGRAAADVGIAAVARLDPVNKAADALPGLVEATGCTAMLSVFGTMGPTVVRWERTHPPLITALGVGSVLPLLRSATGHVFLAWSPEAMTAPFVRAEDPAVTAASLEALRSTVRKADMAEARETFIPGLYALAGPVLDLQRQAAAAVTIVATDRTLLDTASPQRCLFAKFLEAQRT